MTPALTIELAQSGELVCRVPANAASRESSFIIPKNEHGMAVLVRVLEARARATQQGHFVGVGHEGSPNLSMIEDWLRAGHRVTREPGAKVSEVPAEELGL